MKKLTQSKRSDSGSCESVLVLLLFWLSVLFGCLVFGLDPLSSENKSPPAILGKQSSRSESPGEWLGLARLLPPSYKKGQ